MTHITNLTGVEHNCLIGITSFLDYQDVFHLATANKSFEFLITNNAVWKSQIETHVPTNLIYFDEDFPNLSPKEQFTHIINRCITIKTCLANLINKVDPDFKAKEFLENNFVNNQKAKEGLDKLIAETYEKIPLDYYLLFRLLNGQKILGGKFEQDTELFGGFFYYDFLYKFFFLPLSKPENNPFLAQYKFHTLAMCNYSGARLFVDFHNVLKQGHGAIITFREQRTEYGKNLIRTYIFKPHILRFLEDLQYSFYTNEQDLDLIDHFDSFHRPLSDVTTNGIRIRTSAIFNPWDRQNRPSYLFTYQIRVSPNGVQGHWKLTQRHWVINDNGEPHDVKGPGVIGLYPEVYEGCPEFTYQSCTPMKGFNGTMGGELYFRNLATKEEIKATVGEMKLELPKGTCLLDFCPDDGEVKVVLKSEN